MIFEEKTIILKDGRTAILKSPCVEDAEKLLNYIKKSCSETDFLARYPEEWTTTIGQEEAWVNRLRSAPDTLGITCYVDGEDAGNCEISFRGDMKVSHRATIANLFPEGSLGCSCKDRTCCLVEGFGIAFSGIRSNGFLPRRSPGCQCTNLQPDCLQNRFGCKDMRIFKIYRRRV